MPWFSLRDASSDLEGAAFAANPTPMCLYERRTLAVLDVNRAAVNLYGYSRNEMKGKTIDLLRAPQDGLQDVVEAFSGITSLRQGRIFKHRRKNGEVFFAEVRTHDLTYGGRAARLMAAEDVTAAIAAEQEISQRHAALVRAEQIAHLGSYAYNHETGFAYWSDELYRLLRVSPGGVNVADGLWPFHYPHDAQRVRRELSKAQLHRKAYDIEHRLICSDGTITHVQEQGHWVYDDAGTVRAQYGTVLDITDRKTTESSLVDLAYHDALTGLRNRTGLRQDIRRIVSNYEGNSLVGVLFVDLDRFKIINDTLGHRVGDAVLAEVSRRLRAAVSANDIVSRTGGDEFIIVLDGMPDKMSISERAQGIIDALAPAITVGEHEHFLSASIGISLFPLDGKEPDALLRNADVAMYAVKKRGGVGFSYYTPDLQYAASRRFRLERALRHALGRSELSLRYQPIIDARSGAIAAVEALLRWNSLELGPIEPSEFIALADETGLISSIGRWAMDQAFMQTAQWARAGLALRTWINISPHQLHDPNFVRMLEELRAAHDLRADLIGLEITEDSFIARPSEAEDALRELRSAGVGLALGDFGVRHCALTRLQTLAIDTVKIDRCFVEGIDRNSYLAEAAHAIVRLCRKLGLSVTAEGIERSGQLDVLRSMDCDAWQGALYGEAREPRRGRTPTAARRPPRHLGRYDAVVLRCCFISYIRKSAACSSSSIVRPSCGNTARPALIPCRAARQIYRRGAIC